MKIYLYCTIRITFVKFLNCIVKNEMNGYNWRQEYCLIGQYMQLQNMQP